MSNTLPRLGVNIDHFATLRQLRGTPYPDLAQVIECVESAGAQQITLHLREDRRHIQDADVKMARAQIRTLMNLEMACTEEMIRIARRIGPDWVCVVPEKRAELTTEGGLELKKSRKRLEACIRTLQRAKIKVSLFVEPSLEAVKTSAELGADAVELHTGRYCLKSQAIRKSASQIQSELRRISKAAQAAISAGLGAHAGHGLDLENIRPIVDLDLIAEYNVGHSLVCRSALVGVDQAVREMLAAIQAP